ncbi:putative membrane protein YeiH [Sphingomonas sp. SORGH_AS 950]|uniref:trimeric intracellular cation channel family protein n=1 Tax=unclassified Sphingomonas TaxID=196159 RepID=UPI00277E5643|nr:MULTISPECIES: trimeric intracellular cation channel family protein [unclassified Sphingomonas]MDQ1158605.1 putative membrane protein YeiH [Sphingomonas sp. SORGH_AS_0950]MDR6113553.1 putative membrane protein YeiH [Sphingomonas sp. SORGH_AS_0789]MDR6145340.1 putative membrane protein YeiH [Sphingomonas sp. SORGH_AS_0870]MDR6149086.1 putative membrane protein YeiH [Sphingomonas sp. SORGH_AS_0742]
MLPEPTAMLPAVMPWLDLAGLAVFAVSGALAAARHRQTMVTLVFFALITGVGGGTLRDLLLNAPVFWVHDPRVPLVCLVAAVAVWATPARWWRGSALDWFDAVGLAAYAVYGAAKASGYGISPIPAAMLGVVSACVGGIIRDVIAGEPSILMRPELYVTAAALASTSYVLLSALGVPGAGPIAALAGFALRGAAIRYRLALPAYPAKG